MTLVKGIMHSNHLGYSYDVVAPTQVGGWWVDKEPIFIIPHGGLMQYVSFHALEMNGF
jgi:hypothetical protein